MGTLKRGFTLIDLMIVVAIIAIVIVAAVPACLRALRGNSADYAKEAATAAKATVVQMQGLSAESVTATCLPVSTNGEVKCSATFDGEYNKKETVNLLCSGSPIACIVVNVPR